MTLCKFSTPSDYDCGCANKREFRQCGNVERLLDLDNRFDGAAFHTRREDGVFHVDARYCCFQHCQDFKPMANCCYATQTMLKWAGDVANCRVVECRNPQAFNGGLRSFKDKNGVDLGGVRRACDERFNLIPNADYLHVRSRYCNKEYCPLFTEESSNE